MNLDQFRRAANLSSDLAARWYPHMVKAMVVFNITKPSQQADFIAQIGTESLGFTRLRESMNYSPDGLLATFPRNRISAADCRRLGRKQGETTVPQDRQREIANLVYGGRFGNTGPDDGWTYRGAGLKQVTFKANFEECGVYLGLDLVAHPELLTSDENAAMSAGWFWESHKLNAYSDRGDFDGLTKVVNGGYNGLVDRVARREVARKVLVIV